jgi:hypothetical protein
MSKARQHTASGRAVRRSERVEAGGSMPTARPTSARCRAEHEVPYTLRCTLEVWHELTGQPHLDKEGNVWDS